MAFLGKKKAKLKRRSPCPFFLGRLLANSWWLDRESSLESQKTDSLVAIKSNSRFESHRHVEGLILGLYICCCPNTLLRGGGGGEGEESSDPCFSTECCYPSGRKWIVFRVFYCSFKSSPAVLDHIKALTLRYLQPAELLKELESLERVPSSSLKRTWWLSICKRIVALSPESRTLEY